MPERTPSQTVGPFLHIGLTQGAYGAREIFSAAVADPGPDASIAAALAKAFCSQAFTHAAKECIQIHGGIGYTWEHDAHLYLRRAKSSELLFGTPSRLRSRVASLVGI